MKKTLVGKNLSTIQKLRTNKKALLLIFFCFPALLASGSTTLSIKQVRKEKVELLSPLDLSMNPITTTFADSDFPFQKPQPHQFFNLAKALQQRGLTSGKLTLFQETGAFLASMPTEEFLQNDPYCIVGLNHQPLPLRFGGPFKIISRSTRAGALRFWNTSCLVFGDFSSPVLELHHRNKINRINLLKVFHSIGQRAVKVYNYLPQNRGIRGNQLAPAKEQPTCIALTDILAFARAPLGTMRITTIDGRKYILPKAALPNYVVAFAHQQKPLRIEWGGPAIIFQIKDTYDRKRVIFNTVALHIEG